MNDDNLLEEKCSCGASIKVVLPTTIGTCDLTDIHFVVESQRPLLTPAMSHALKSAAGAHGPRFEEEKPPTPASRYEQEPVE